MIFQDSFVRNGIGVMKVISIIEIGTWMANRWLSDQSWHRWIMVKNNIDHTGNLYKLSVFNWMIAHLIYAA
jgi:hypothetical protein